MHKIHRIISSCTCVKYYPGLCSLFIQSVVSNDSVCGQWRPRSDCANAQADLGLHCPHMPQRHVFAWRGPDSFRLKSYPTVARILSLVLNCKYLIYLFIGICCDRCLCLNCIDGRLSIFTFLIIKKSDFVQVFHKMGQVMWKCALEHAKNAQNQIILCVHKVSSEPLLSIHTFWSIQWFC